jgi:tRNA-splicing ligase RtcB (3'-phosphate/5'-hydroxy nucleic acid ligase)
LQKGRDGFVWIMIHSGSRNLGFKVAGHYDKLAIDLNEKWHSKVPKKWQLAFLPLDSQEGQEYMNEMSYCVDFAHRNRILMMKHVRESIEKICGDVNFDTPIDVAHNYAAMENHFGKNVLVHRKGATKAYEGQLGLIPGSQGSASYIVEGLGNPDSFKSCSHGAGRRMSRTKAKNELDLATEIKHMNDLGIVHGLRHQKDLDEAMGAYKNIDKVMALQKDLVKIKVKLMPLAVIKG